MKSLKLHNVLALMAIEKFASPYLKYPEREMDREKF
jgi:hypothetical protein